MDVDQLAPAAVYFEAPDFIYKEQRWQARIATASEVLEGCNTLLLKVQDGAFCQKQAERALSNKMLILWELTLSLTLPLETAREQLSSFWLQLSDDLRTVTAGVMLFSGAVEELTQQVWPWVPEGHFAEWCSSLQASPEIDLKPYYGVALLDLWTTQLTSDLFDKPLCFACLDASRCDDLLGFYQLTQRTRNEQLHIFWRTPQPEYIADLVWQQGVAAEGFLATQQPMLGQCDTALCLPAASCWQSDIWNQLKDPLDQLSECAIAYRPVSQELMALMWTGFDRLIVVSAALTSLERRQLAGFAAAGGQVVVIGASIGIADEITFAEWCQPS
jgi:hypothetical protein